MAPTWHGSLPWGWLRNQYAAIRKRHFPKDRPHGKYYLVQAPVDFLEKELGSQSFAPNWEYSYYKRGEVMNLARVEWWADHEHTDEDGELITWWQLHVRAWEAEDGLHLRAHWEPEPTEHPKAHLKGTGFHVSQGMAKLAGTLDGLGIEYTTDRWSGE